MLKPPAFLFATCQVGAERAVKAEVTGRWADIHAAFARPGFLTFKVPGDHPVDETFNPHSVFTRASGLSLGKANAESIEERAQAVWQLAASHPVRRLHVWQRDQTGPRDQHYEPGVNQAALEVESAILTARNLETAAAGPISIGSAVEGELVLDCVLVDPQLWWIGLHVSRDVATCWPGGICPNQLPSHAVSRAYLKMQEALAWSELPVRRGDRFVEIGCAPGGASQALLERGMEVIGIDPADVDPVVAAHRHFTHIKKRGADVPRRQFSGVRWLAADINVAPGYTLDTVEAIVTHQAVRIEGLLLTLKLLDWKLAAEVPEYIERVRRWGYRSVHARQLSHNRQEICVAALKKSSKQ